MKIAAVVVTYNRLNLLKECINAIRNQTHKVDEIIVVNNSSTDGTLEWLSQQNDLTVIIQENSGSAGGQYTGIKTAYGKGYDWIWCMDDDGRPSNNCLEILIQNMDNLNDIVMAPLVISSENSERLAFNIPWKGKNNLELEISTILELQKHIYGNYFKGWASFFNGVLIPHSVIAKIGLPKRDMFIWGDEVEYFLRIKKNNIEIITFTKAIYFHPINRLKFKEKLFGVNIYPANKDWRSYFYFRNSVYIAKKYGKMFGLKFTIVHIFYFLFIKPLDFYSTYNTLRAFYCGIFEKFSISNK